MFTITKDEQIKSIQRDNPWWKAKKIPFIKNILHKRGYYDEFAKLALNFDIQRSIILMGPRRVGKTIMIYQLIHQAIEEGFNPNAIFFASLDTPQYSGFSLHNLMDLYQEEMQIDFEQRTIIIFDEIQYHDNWEQHLKSLTDRYPQIRFIASGSAAAALNRKSRESGAGRFTDFILPPLTFSEFLKFRDYSDGKDDITKLNQEFIHYLNFGGYPEAVSNQAVKENTPQFLGKDIINKILLNDLPSLYGIQNIQELKRLFMTIAYNTGQEFSLDKLSSYSGVQKNTISRYLEYLEAAFLIFRIDRIDNNCKHYTRKMVFKLYLYNPSMRSLIFDEIKEDDIFFGALVETAICAQYIHYDTLDTIFYARWRAIKTDYEVDLVKVTKDFKPLAAIEVKWSDSIVENPHELKALLKFANQYKLLQVRVTTKSITNSKVIDGVQIDFTPSASWANHIGDSLFASKKATLSK